jgi:signal transduction histidine kinase
MQSGIILRDFFRMSDVIKHGQAAFEPRARLLKLLGGELIRDDVMALLEIIKNSHDADASLVKVSFENAMSRDGTITIADDGTGMTVEHLLNHWMQPAGSSKRLIDRRSPKGRRYLGEKGVGRFAVDRLGVHCEVISRPPKSKTKVIARFDWDAFDVEDAFLSEIEMNWEERRADRTDSYGTIIRITGLRHSWTQRSFRRLCNRSQRLMSPFKNGGDEFRIDIVSDDFPDYSGEVSVPYFDTAPYRLQAHFDGRDTIKFDSNGNVGEIIWPGPGSLECGPVSLSLHGFDLEPESLKRLGQVQSVRSWLREWSGVSVYRDGFRVLPYGEPDDDWLRLDQRRVNNPVVRLSNNQVVGIISITADENPELLDQTNRMGLVFNRQFEDIRRLTIHVLEILEKGRRKIRNPREPRNGVGSTVVAEEGVETILRSLRQHAVPLAKKTGFALGQSLDDLSRAYLREKKSLTNTIDVQTDLTAIGLNAPFILSSLRPILETLDQGLSDLADEVESPKLLNLSRMMETARENLELLVPVQSPVQDVARELDLVRELRGFSIAATNIGSHEGITIVKKLPDNDLFLVDGRRDILWQILTILLQNSIQSMGRAERKEVRIGLKMSRNRKENVVTFRDRGCGVQNGLEKLIFDPGYTTRRGARGMGLYIARVLANEMNASLMFRGNNTSGGWTSFELRFPVASLLRRKEH